MKSRPELYRRYYVNALEGCLIFFHIQMGRLQLKVPAFMYEALGCLFPGWDSYSVGLTAPYIKSPRFGPLP